MHTRESILETIQVRIYTKISLNNKVKHAANVTIQGTRRKKKKREKAAR